MAKTDEELMFEFKSGNIEALDEIFQRYKKRFLNFALRLLTNLADAEDAVSETFFIINSKKTSYEPKARFSTWAYTVLRNLCIDRIRSRGRLTFMWFAKKETGGYEEIKIAEIRRDNDVLVKADHDNGTAPLKKHSTQKTLETDPQLAVGVLVIKSKLVEARL